MAHKDDITFADIKQLIDNALTEFYSNDSVLLEYDTEDKAVAERCMVFRIGWYMLNQMKSLKKLRWADLDCEYNRNFVDPKYMYVWDTASNKYKKKNIVPDLLLHKRKSNENNLLVIEFKKGDPEPDARNKDIQKLTYFTDPAMEYAYNYGLYIELYRNSAVVQVYQDGMHCEHLDYRWQAARSEQE